MAQLRGNLPIMHESGARLTITQLALVDENTAQDLSRLTPFIRWRDGNSGMQLDLIIGRNGAVK